MKRQFFFDHVERDLLRCALEFWSAELSVGMASKAYKKCGEFTQRRLAEMKSRLSEATEKVDPRA